MDVFIPRCREKVHGLFEVSFLKWTQIRCPSSLYLKTKTSSLIKNINFYNSRQWIKSKNSVIQSIICHHQNPLESTCRSTSLSYPARWSVICTLEECTFPMSICKRQPENYVRIQVREDIWFLILQKWWVGSAWEVPMFYSLHSFLHQLLMINSFNSWCIGFTSMTWTPPTWSREQCFIKYSSDGNKEIFCSV